MRDVDGEWFTGTCGGLAIAGPILYVTDDTDNEGWLVGFDLRSMERQIDSSRDSRDGEPVLGEANVVFCNGAI